MSDVAEAREARDAVGVAEAKAREARPAAIPGKGGVYIPPHKLRQMQEGMSKDPKNAAFQRMHWEALKKSINGLINKINTTNIKDLIPEVFAENIVRGRGLLCRSSMKAQLASPNFSHVYAALMAVVNTKMPEIGELIIKRYIMQFRRAYRRNDKIVCIAATKFLAHAVNQQFVHELLALQMLTLLLENPTDDAVEIAVDFIKECGQILTKLAPRGFHAVFERLRAILHEGEIDKRVQYVIEGLFAVRKGEFKDYPAVVPELDLVELDDQITHELSLSDEHDIQKDLDVFKFDPDWEANEKAYEDIKKEILGDDEEEEGKEGAGEDEDDEGAGAPPQEQQPQGGSVAGIEDKSDADIINLRRTIYLTIMNSLDFEECAHKLLKNVITPGTEAEVPGMIIECCSQERTYMRFYGLLGERFCQLNPTYQHLFEDNFATHYATIHRFETNRLRNIAKFFGHLLYTDAIDWSVIGYIHLNAEETTSSSRIFIKILFRELSELMGLAKLKARLDDPSMQESFLGIFPRDHPKNMRFSINFFTSIGLGGLTEALRTYLKNAPKQIMAQQVVAETAESDSSDSDSSSSSDSSDSSSSDSDSDSEDDKRKSKGKSSKVKKEKRGKSNSRSRSRSAPARRAAKSKSPEIRVKREEPERREKDRREERGRDSGRDNGRERGGREREKEPERHSRRAPSVSRSPAPVSSRARKASRSRSRSTGRDRNRGRDAAPARRQRSRSPARRRSPSRSRS